MNEGGDEKTAREKRKNINNDDYEYEVLEDDAESK
jgi:hypothetical protein